MIITFTNVIGAIRNAISSVITTNLKMWLGFETSETLGGEEVVNGDFATDSDWILINNSTIVDGVANVVADGNIGNSNTSWSLKSLNNVFQLNKTYRIKFRAKQVSLAGSNAGAFQLGYSYFPLFDQVITNEFVDYEFVATPSTFSTILNLTAGGRTAGDVFQIDDISVKELTQITPDKSGNNNVGELFTGKALEFDGSTSYVSANSFAGTLSTGDAFTFAIWFNSDKTPTDFFRNILISSGGPEQYTNIFKIGVNPQTSATGSANVGGIYFDDSAGGYNNVVPLSGGVNYNDGEWHRLVVSRQQGSGVQDLSFYVDGSYIGKADCNPYWNNVNLFDFGQEWDGAGTSDHFGGMMADIQVYDYAWTVNDVTYDYANPQNLVTDRGGTIDLSNLKGYWALSEGDGLVAYDSSGEGNNGTINGANYEPAQPRIPQLGMMNWSKGNNLVENSNEGTYGNSPGSEILTTNPFGNNTAVRPVPDSVSDRYQETLLAANISTADTYTYSWFSKQITTPLESYTGNLEIRNLVNCTVVSGSQEQIATNIGGFDRFKVSFTIDDGSIDAIFRVYFGNVIGIGNSSVAYWGHQLNEGSSADSFVLTDGAATLNSTVIANPTIPTQDIFGNLVRDRLNSFNLDGSGYAEVADDADLNFGTGDFTLECWVRIDGNTDRRLLDKRNTTSGYTLYLTGSNVLKLELNDNIIPGNETFNLTSSLNSNTWLHLAIVCDRSANATCYVNKAAQSPVNISSKNGNINSTSNLIVGADAPDGLSLFSTDIISDVRLYDRVLTSDEVENNYNAGLSAHTN